MKTLCFIAGIATGGFIVWFLKVQLIAFWQWITPFIKRGEAAAVAEANKALGKK